MSRTPPMPTTTTPSWGAKAMAKGRYIAFRLRQRPLMAVGLGIIICVVTAAVFAPLIAHYDPYAINLRARLQPPESAHWFGTDEVGRDIFSRVVYGARQSVSIGIFIVLIAGGVGSTLGGFSAMIGGWTDTAIMRLMDVLLSFPSLVLIMALAAALGPSLLNAMLAIAIVRIPFYVRLTRGQALTLRSMDYVRAARTFGIGNWRILRWHIAPNALSPIIVQGTLDLGGAILMASALSFIGLGAQQPTAEWGSMVATGRNFILDQWWYSGFPGFAILITAMGFNLLGDGLRDILDPKQKERQ